MSTHRCKKLFSSLRPPISTVTKATTSRTAVKQRLYIFGTCGVYFTCKHFTIYYKHLSDEPPPASVLVLFKPIKMFISTPSTWNIKPITKFIIYPLFIDCQKISAGLLLFDHTYVLEKFSCHTSLYALISPGSS